MSHSIPKKLLDDAVRFHGHMGPFLILGLKASLFANEILGKDHLRTTAIVETEPMPPCSCFVDGVQIATGCTMGKGNIQLKKGPSLSVTFLRDGRTLQLSLKGEVLQSLRRNLSKDESEKTALSLSKKSVQELFDIKNKD